MPLAASRSISASTSTEVISRFACLRAEVLVDRRKQRVADTDVDEEPIAASTNGHREREAEA